MKLEDFSVKQLKTIMAKYNKSVGVKGYSKLKKDELIKHLRSSKNIKITETEKGVKIVVVNTIMEEDKKVKEPLKIKAKIVRTKKEPKKAPAKQKKEEPKTEPKVEDKPKKKEEPKKDDLITLMDKFNKKYNAVEIKKQNLNKSNLKTFTDPYFKELEKIEKELEKVDDPIEFFKSNKKISSEFTDIKKNFVRRVKAHIKAERKKKK